MLKSESATLRIPELHVELTQYSSMGGRFTTVEGILVAIRNDLSNNPFVLGDSSEKEAQQRFHEFLSLLDDYIRARRPFTLEIDDPLANSYIQNLRAPEPDAQLSVEEYTRTFEQDDELGLHDMRTEDYQ